MALLLMRKATAGASDSVCSLPHANPSLPGFARALTGRSRVDPTSTGGGVGRGVAASPVLVATPLPVPPPQGGRERRRTSLHNIDAVPAWAIAFAALLASALLWSLPARAADPPRRIVSFNVCADQLALALADPAQIVALSPNAADPAISVLAEQA